MQLELEEIMKNAFINKCFNMKLSFLRCKWPLDCSKGPFKALNMVLSELMTRSLGGSGSQQRDLFLISENQMAAL